MIAWTDRTHGRGPGFRSRAELQRRRQLRSERSRREVYRLIAQVEEQYGVPLTRTRARVETLYPAPWYVRVWRRILAVLGYGPFGR